MTIVKSVRGRAPQTKKHQMNKIEKANFGLFPQTPEQWQALGNDVVEWAERKDSVCIRDFAKMRGYSPYKFNKWGIHSEDFEDCLDMAKSVIASRREIKALTKKYNSEMTIRMMPFYDKEYKEFLIQQKNDSADKVVRLLVQPIEDTGIPKFNKDED